MSRTLAASAALVLALAAPASALADEDGAQAPSPAPAADPPLAQPAPAARRSTALIGRFHGGLGQRRLFKTSALGADLTAGIGAHTETVNVYADMQLMFASSEGLPVRHYLFGPTLDFEPFSRFRLGIGIAVGGTTVTGANGRTMSAFSVGGRAFGSVDLWNFSDDGALYLLAQISVDSAGTLGADDNRGSVPVTALWGPTIALGVRF